MLILNPRAQYEVGAQGSSAVGQKAPGVRTRSWSSRRPRPWPGGHGLRSRTRPRMPGPDVDDPGQIRRSRRSQRLSPSCRVAGHRRRSTVCPWFARQGAAPRRRRTTRHRCRAGSTLVRDGSPQSGRHCDQAPGHLGTGADAGTSAPPAAVPISVAPAGPSWLLPWLRGPMPHRAGGQTVYLRRRVTQHTAATSLSLPLRHTPDIRHLTDVDPGARRSLARSESFLQLRGPGDWQSFDAALEV